MAWTALGSGISHPVHLEPLLIQERDGTPLVGQRAVVQLKALATSPTQDGTIGQVFIVAFVIPNAPAIKYHGRVRAVRESDHVRFGCWVCTMVAD